MVVTWDAARKSAGITLTNGLLTMTTATTGQSVAATLSREASTANHYWELATISGGRLPIGLVGSAMSNFEQSLNTASPGTALFSFSGFFYCLALGTPFQASGGSTGAGFEPAPMTACCLARLGSIYFGVIGSVGGQWYDCTSGTFKATYDLCTPFVTGASGLIAPATGSGSLGACSATGNFAGPFTGVLPIGAAAWAG